MALGAEDRGRFVTDANSAVCFKLIRRESDIIDTKNTFHPDFSHQFFGQNETIYGFTDLRVKLYYSACTLDIYLGLSYDQKVSARNSADSVQADDICSIVGKTLPPGFFTSSDAFVARLPKQHEFRPFGHLLHSYEIEQGSEKRRFEMYKVDEATPAFISHFERVQTFALWFIDAASYIDTDDPLWKFYMMYEKYKDDDGNVCFAVCGYSCVYHYYAYPDKIRPRIGHILVLPPFQKRGHGVQLLQAIYNELVPNKKVLDITAEDPSDNFVLLRDYVDSINCSRLHAYQPSELKKGFSKCMIEEAHQKLKIPKRQARRVYEILRFKHLDASDPVEFKQFRLEVKRRLYAPFQKDQRDWKKISKALDEHELQATAAVQMSVEQRMEMLQKQFEETLDAYRITLNKLATNHRTPSLNMTLENGLNGQHHQ